AGGGGGTGGADGGDDVVVAVEVDVEVVVAAVAVAVAVADRGVDGAEVADRRPRHGGGGRRRGGGGGAAGDDVREAGGGVGQEKLGAARQVEEGRLGDLEADGPHDDRTDVATVAADELLVEDDDADARHVDPSIGLGVGVGEPGDEQGAEGDL